MKQNTQIAKTTRLFRKIHRWISIPLFIFFFLIGVTGLLLGWKKQILLLPKTQKGNSIKSKNWLSIDTIQYIAARHAQHILKKDAQIDRIDIRPAKGVAKIIFLNHFTELQIDCTSGKILSVNRRNSDIIEKIHDGSIIDYWISTANDEVKLFYTTTVSLSLILLSISGFFLWYNPIRMRKIKQAPKPFSQ
ncbi:MAG: PepSY-associated TM helix domain-containing protein [Microscillaceae bacterium]|nr:PepSY-associated TM helix domain-containing protein [Microscillaceae bacterium]